MRGSKQFSHAISGLFVFILLGVFAVLSTVMVLMGAKVYRSTVDQFDAHNSARIAPAYVRSMVRAEDEQGVVRLEEAEGLQTITMLHSYDDEAYVTRIYCYEGQLYEWFSDAENPFVPEDGEAVCPCEALEAELSDGLLSVRILQGGEWTEAAIALRAAR